MAGIGFELRKVIGRGGLGSFVKAALSGTMIVAGPWLLSIISIFTMNRLAGTAIGTVPGLFMAVIVYAYAVSLVLFGGSHYVFTRIIADLSYDRKERAAAAALVLFSIAVVLLSLAVSVPVMHAFPFPVASPALFRVSAVVLFATVNYIWLLMLFVSLPKKYAQILVSYAVGMAAGIGAVYRLGETMSVSGALAGFAAGHLVIAVLLSILAFRAYKPGPLRAAVPLFGSYFSRFRLLFFTGLFYTWGMWADKIIFWFTRGTPVAGTIFHLYEGYDLIVYFTNLTMIPGLVFFVISSETAFYVLLRRFLVSLSRGRFADIRNRKLEMIRGMRSGLAEQSLFQGIVTLGVIMLAPLLYPIFAGQGLAVFRITAAAVFFHLLYLTLMNYFFYVEDYRNAFLSALIFLVVNAGIAAGSVFVQFPVPAGSSYLAASVSASLFSFPSLLVSLRVFDRKILAGT